MADILPLILASGSKTRLRMLRSAEVPVEVAVPAIDEAEVKASLRHDGAPAAKVAEILAEMKAQRIASKARGRLVLGCDQMLECDGAWFDKPASRDDARTQLRFLRGKSHSLITSAVLVRDDARLWHVTDRAELRMRAFSDEFLEWYLDQVGEDVLHSVGAYQLEWLGVQLFERVTGDYFTILGLPLLPVLGILREHGMVTR
jgi:septum formation protein